MGRRHQRLPWTKHHRRRHANLRRYETPRHHQRYLATRPRKRRRLGKQTKERRNAKKNQQDQQNPITNMPQAPNTVNTTHVDQHSTRPTQPRSCTLSKSFVLFLSVYSESDSLCFKVACNSNTRVVSQLFFYRGTSPSGQMTDALLHGHISHERLHYENDHDDDHHHFGSRRGIFSRTFPGLRSLHCGIWNEKPMLESQVAVLGNGLFINFG